MKQLLLFVLIICPALSFSQRLSYEAMVKAGGYVSSEDQLPLWMYTNGLGEVGAESSFSSTAALDASYAITDKSAINFGGSAYFRNNVKNEFQRKELFLEFRNSWLAVIAGAKQLEEVAQGLSSTNQNFLWSRNNRPLAGVRIETSRPIRLNRTFSFDAAIAHYELNDDRYVANTRVHYKDLSIITQLNERNKITGKIQHVAQWAGTSPQFGKLPDDFGAFIDVFFAKEAQESGEVGEVANAVGNHLGTYLLDYEYSADFGTTSLYHEHPFEDGSGMRLANFPDGVWGVYFRPNENKYITGFLYEYITTKDQSGAFGVGQDNYFGNRIYRSGYSYEGAIIGFPFIQNDPSLVLDENTIAIVNNRVSVHHFGLAGTFMSVDWKLKSSIAKSFGRYINPFPEPVTTSHHFIEVGYTTKKYGIFTINLGLDTSSLSDTLYGGGVQYAYFF